MKTALLALSITGLIMWGMWNATKTSLDEIEG